MMGKKRRKMKKTNPKLKMGGSPTHPSSGMEQAVREAVGEGGVGAAAARCCG